MADEDIVINEGVWVSHPDNPDAPVLISSTALEAHEAQGFVEMKDRARVRDADQIRLFGPPAEPGKRRPSGGTSTGASGAGEG